MSDKQSVWARQAFHDLISRAAENGPYLDQDSAAPLLANIGAMKALCGVSDAPGADIAALLRSDHPIEPEVREALARALDGIAPIRLEVVGLSYGKESRRRQGLSINLQRGRSAIELMGSLGYDQAIAATAREAGVSNKTIVANVAFARRVDAWIAFINPHQRAAQCGIGKASRAPAGAATWIKLESQSLDNGSGLEPSDFVGVATLWEKPDVFHGLTTWHLYMVQQGLAAGDWRESVQAKDWVGHLVAKVAGLSAETDKGRIKAILRTWRKNGALAVEHRTVNGRDVPFVIVGKPVDPSEIGTRPHLQTCGAEGVESAGDDPC